MRRLAAVAGLSLLLASCPVLAADSPVGRWRTVDDKTGGKVYKAEIWVEDGKLKVRGYLGVFYKTQTWLKAA